MTSPAKSPSGFNQSQFFGFGEGLDGALPDQGLGAGAEGFLIHHRKRAAGARVPRGPPLRMHPETPLKVLRDPRIKRLVRAFQDIKKPFLLRLFA